MSIYRTRHSDINVKSIKNSLSEILPNKTPESIERTKFEQSQTSSILKAINQVEQPVKEKHVRNIILGTYNHKSSMLFWSTLNKLQLQSNPITCWKFLYVLHRLMRDAHSNTLQDSCRHTRDLQELAKLWIHLKVDYGQMITNYCNFLVFKLNFHQKYKTIPGNLNVSNDLDLHAICSNNIDTYFQMCCEFFDYLDEILMLQNSIFISMDRSRANSMTDHGQCKLSPLILCIQESNQIYDFTVKFLFKLHDNLIGDVLDGHRQRFVKQFKMLKDFYDTCKNLQYFKNIIQIPELPLNPPNFHVSNDFQTYTKPVVLVPDTEIDLSIDDDTSSILVDFSDYQHSPPVSASATPSLQQQTQIDIQPYIAEIENLRSELERVSIENELEIRGLRERIKDLRDELNEVKCELEQTRIKCVYLEEQLKTSQENEKAKEDLEILERKATCNEDKFNKMKDLYTKLRQEHLTLLKQDSELRKQLSLLKQTHDNVKSVSTDLEKNFALIKEEKDKMEHELMEKINEIRVIRQDCEKSTQDLFESRQSLIKELHELDAIKSKLEEELKQNRVIAQETTQIKEQNDVKIIELNENLNKAKIELDAINETNEKLNLKLTESENKLLKTQKDSENHIKETNKLLLYSIIRQSIKLIKETLNKYDDPILLCCKSGAEYLLSLLQPVQMLLLSMTNEYSTQTSVNSQINQIYSYSILASEFLITGKITSLTAADLKKSNELSEHCKFIGEACIKLFELMLSNENVDNQFDELNNLFKNLMDIVHELLPKIHDISKEELGDLVEQEMHKTSQAIEDACVKLSDLLMKSREKETGIKLEVNDKILDSCTNLMKAIKILIIKSKELQKEICSQGRGTSSTKEFYAKNHKWTEGLVSAAKLVGLGATTLIEKADKLVNGNDGKMEEIIVCSHEISASTTQLVVASRVKADSHSANLKQLIDAKTQVTNQTGTLVASAKTCLQIIEEEQVSNMDSFNNLSFHQTKKLEIESQVRVLELEKQLEQERLKLSRLRKQHYNLEN